MEQWCGFWFLGDGDDGDGDDGDDDDGGERGGQGKKLWAGIDNCLFFDYRASKIYCKVALRGYQAWRGSL